MSTLTRFSIGLLSVVAILTVFAVLRRPREESPVPAAAGLRRLEGTRALRLAPSDPARAVGKPAVAGQGELLLPGDSLQEKDGTYRYCGTTYDALLDRGTIEFGLPGTPALGNRPVISYTFRNLTVGDRVVARGGETAPQAGADERRVVYLRGTVEERYTFLKEGIEQDFVISELPEGRGAITVTGTVDSNLKRPPVGPSNRLAFTHGGKEGIEIRDAVAVDADGRRLPLQMDWSGTELSLTVAADWVAEARLPITIDPILAGFASFGLGGASVVWVPTRNQWFGVYPSSSDIYANVVDANGIFYQQLTLTTGSDVDTAVAVSYAPEVDRILVVWRNKPVGAVDERLMGRVLTSQYAWFGPSFVIGDYPGSEDIPSISWDGSNWYVVYGNFQWSTIRGRFISSAGVPGIEAHPAPADSSGDGPIVRFGNGVHFVVWNNTDTWPGATLFARAVSPAGVMLTPTTDMADPGEFALKFDAAAGPGTFLVTWSSDSKVKARQVTPSLTFAGGQLQLYPREFTPYYVTLDYANPKVVYSPINSAWYVVYQEGNHVPQGMGAGPHSYPVRGRHIWLDGTVSPFEELIEGFTVSNMIIDTLAMNPSANQAMFVFRTPVFAVGRRIDLNLPRAVSNLVAIPGNGQAETRWDPMAGAESYNILRADSPGGPFKTVVSGLTSTSYLNTGLTNGTAYTYQVTAVVNQHETLANQVAVTPSSNVLFVVGSLTLGTGDTAIRTRLQNAGYTVILRTATATTVDAAGTILVVISSTVNPTTVGNKFRTLALPVVTWENGIFDDMGMTGTVSGTDFGTTGNQTAVAIAQPSHPLAAGLSGTVGVAGTPGAFSWGVPNANGVKAATLATNSARATVFGYDTGVIMPGLTAPARRVGLFMTDTTAASFTAAGGSLFDAAVAWATRAGGSAFAAFAAGGPRASLEGRGEFLSLEQAAAAALPGDVILLGSGTYSLGAGLSVPAGISIRGAGPHQTVVEATGASAVLALMGKPSDRPVTVEGLTVTGGVRGIDLGSAHAILRNVQVAGLLGDGIVTGPESALEAVSLTVADNAGIGLVLGSPQASLRGLIIVRNARGGIQGPSGIRLSYSTLHGNGAPTASGGLSLTGTGLGFAAPLFLDSTGLDYREAPGSPSINAGDPTDAFRLESTPHGGRINQGAFGNTRFASP